MHKKYFLVHWAKRVKGYIGANCLIFIISAIVPAIYNFFLAFSLTYPSRLFIILSPFPLIFDIKMYHRALFIATFSEAFLSDPAFLWLYLAYHKQNISKRVTDSISPLIFIRSWKYKHPRVFGHVGRHLLVCSDWNRIYIVFFCMFALYWSETRSSSIDVLQQPDRATPVSLPSRCKW